MHTDVHSIKYRRRQTLVNTTANAHCEGGAEVVSRRRIHPVHISFGPVDPKLTELNAQLAPAEEI